MFTFRNQIQSKFQSSFFFVSKRFETLSFKKLKLSSQNLVFSWLGTIFCCQTQNENSKEKNSDNEEAVPFTKQENCDHQNGGTVEIPLKATKFQKICSVSKNWTNTRLKRLLISKAAQWIDWKSIEKLQDFGCLTTDCLTTLLDKAG